MIFELKGKLNIDESKKTIVFIDKGKQDTYTHIYGAARVLKEKLANQFNIVTIGSGCGLIDNYYENKRGITATWPRKADDPNYLKINYDTMARSMENSFKDLGDVEYIILGTDDVFRLPLTAYSGRAFSEELCNMKNEFFDYIGDDKEVLNKIDILNNKVIDKWDRYVSPIAFSTCDYSIFMRLIDFLNRTGRLKKKVIGFSIDPAIYTPFFDKLNIPADFYYFADDNRGTRNFKKLDIAQLQHIVYDKNFNSNFNSVLDDWTETDIQKTHNLFFAGTLFQTKGTRRFMWDEFLKDITDDKSSFYIPLRKNGINKAMNKRSDNNKAILEEDETFTKMYNNIINHPNFKGELLPHEMNERIKRYKYGMIFRCVSSNDSLNFRPILYTYNNILPFIDYKYDPEYLQVPKYIQEKLLVRSSNDITEKIKYFNENDNERVVILNELKKIFKINEYINNPEVMINKEIKKIIPEFEC